MIENWNDCSKKGGIWTDRLGRKKFTNTIRSNRIFDRGLLNRQLGHMKSVSKRVKDYDGKVYWHPELETPENQKILIIGAGPSTELLTDDDIESVDQIWSCNHFFYIQ